jgi:hypothetical protein
VVQFLCLECLLQIRQNYGVTVDRGFRPTSNARLQATFAEAKKFADALKKFDKQCTAHLKGVKGTFCSASSSATHCECTPFSVHVKLGHPCMLAGRVRVVLLVRCSSSHAPICIPSRKQHSAVGMCTCTSTLTSCAAIHSRESSRIQGSTLIRALSSLSGCRFQQAHPLIPGHVCPQNVPRALVRRSSPYGGRNTCRGEGGL